MAYLAPERPGCPVVPPQVRYDWTRLAGTRAPSPTLETKVRLEPQVFGTFSSGDVYDCGPDWLASAKNSVEHITVPEKVRLDQLHNVAYIYAMLSPLVTIQYMDGLGLVINWARIHDDPRAPSNFGDELEAHVLFVWRRSGPNRTPPEKVDHRGSIGRGGQMTILDPCTPPPHTHTHTHTQPALP